MVSTVVLLNQFVGFATGKIESRIDLEVYFKDKTSEDDILGIKRKVAAMPEIKDVKYISKSDALQIFKEKHQGDPAIYETITEADNPLPASIKINLNSSNSLDKINGLFRGGEYDSFVDDTSYENNKVIVQKLKNLNRVIKWAGLGIGIIFMIISLIVVFNTIRMTMYTRKEEIEIMKLVGATNWYIRWPFILEGAFYGLISMVIASAVMILLLKFGSPYIDTYFEDIGTGFYQSLLSDTGIIILCVQFVITIFVGVVSSTIAIGRYLKI
jgi:cell division transport system permease protein